ncbi:MAG: hypothetical protein J7K23_03080 [Thermoproteales archaeon]|nr:hypothetical protein [Thermoproteales archaeon]
MLSNFGPKLTKSEYEIIKAVPQSLNYTQVAEKTGFSVAYVSRKLKALKEKVTIHGVFDFDIMGLKEIKILADYDKDFVQKEGKIKIPFITGVYHIVTGKKDYLWIEAYPPKNQVDFFIEGLQLKNYTIYEVGEKFVWMPNKALLTEYSGGYIFGHIEKITEIISKVDVSQPRATAGRVPDEVDLWLIAKLMKYPFTKISREAERTGVRQQVASYHLIRHVKPLWLYNTVTLKLDPDLIPTKLLYFKVENPEFAVKFAASLTHTPYIIESFVVGNEKNLVIAYATIPGGLEMRLIRTLRNIDEVLEFDEIGAMEKDVMLRYTIPFGKIVGGGRWIMDGFYQAIRALSSPKAMENYKPFYDILPLVNE